MNDIIDNNIKNLIYEINGKQVMLDSDLAKLYECKNGTKEVNQAVKNNLEKFPERFSWILTDEDSNIFLVKNFDQKIETRGGRFKNPRVFTEEGIAMLATILHTKVATQISIQIMDAFVSMRHFILDNKDIYQSLNNINNKLIDHDEKLEFIFSRFDKKEQLFFQGNYFDAYYNLYEILSTAKKEIIIIDNYADISLLDLIKNLNCNIILITRNNDRLSSKEIDKYNKQYNNLKVLRDNSFHDRFYIIDRTDFYLSGTSINNVGEKIFMIIKIEYKIVKESLLSYLTISHNL